MSERLAVSRSISWKRRAILSLPLLLAVAQPLQARPFSVATYAEEAFVTAQAKGRTVVIESYAAWCLPCRVQAPILARLKDDTRFDDILLLRVGEDTPETVWKRFGLPGYGMMVVYRDGREVARGMPMTQAAIRQLFLAPG